MNEQTKGETIFAEVERSLKPYNHDCLSCKWVGWFSPYGDKVPMNVYVCGNTVVIRFSDEGSDYWSATIGQTTKGDIGVNEETIKLVEKRRKSFVESNE